MQHACNSHWPCPCHHGVNAAAKAPARPTIKPCMVAYVWVHMQPTLRVPLPCNAADTPAHPNCLQSCPVSMTNRTAVTYAKRDTLSVSSREAQLCHGIRGHTGSMLYNRRHANRTLRPPKHTQPKRMHHTALTYTTHAPCISHITTYT